MAHLRRLEPGPAEPAVENRRRTALTRVALAAADLGPTEPPEPLVLEFGEPEELVVRQIEMLHVGWGEATGRVDEASRDHSPHASVRLQIALTEALLWTRLVDEVLGEAWRRADPAARELASRRTDAWLGRLFAAEPGRHDDSAIHDAYARRRIDGQPYRDWAIATIGSGAQTNPEDFDAFRWLAGKVLHLAPRPVVELAQWRPGAEPRWKWRAAESILPMAQDARRHWANRAAYDRHLAGRDVIGSLNLTMTLIETERMFIRMGTGSGT